MICVGTLLISFGSALFHGTLLYSFQMADELPMIFCISVWCYACYLVENDHYKGKKGKIIRWRTMSCLSLCR